MGMMKEQTHSSKREPRNKPTWIYVTAERVYRQFSGVRIVFLRNDVETTGVYMYGRQNNLSFKDVHVLIPRAYESVTLQNKRDVADVIKLTILTWGDYPRLSRWS